MGFSSGRFLNPLDSSQGVGPWLSINLDTLEPGASLPGLGGDEALPSLEFECPPGGIHEVTISLSCTDGDLRCDQRREFVVGCFHGDWCVAQPIDCSASNECLTSGTCDNGCPPVCDPSSPGYDPAKCDLATGVSGAGTCSQCAGKDRPRPEGTPCSSDGGSYCDGAGACQ